MIPIGSIPSSGSAAIGTAGKTEAPDPSLLKAAKEFESIFVRQMLKSVEKTTAAGCGTKAAPGQSTYGSMIVDTLSDSISKGGGLGLADVIAKSMAASHPGLKGTGLAAPASPAPQSSALSAPKPLK